MDHEEATTSQATERYLLNDLTAEEREQFEEHFFECPECAEAVRTGTMFAETTRELAKERSGRPTISGPVTEIRTRSNRPSWREWQSQLGAIAAILLLGVVGFQNLVTIPTLKKQAGVWSSPRLLTEVVLRPQTRGDVPSMKTGGQDLLLTLPLTTSHPLPSYEVTIQNGSGTVIGTFSGASEDGTIHMTWPYSLTAGDYEVVVREPAPSQAKPSLYPFHYEK